MAQCDLPEAASRLIDGILSEMPMHRNVVDTALSMLTADESARLDAYLHYCLDRGLDMAAIVECYLTIVEDTLREQIHFRRHGRYRHDRFADVAGDVYFNDDYMNRYMYGLTLTTFLWKNHIAISRFFRDTLPVDRPGRYLEVGPGHGFYIMTAAEVAAYDEFLGVDISAASVRQTRATIDHFHPDFGDRLRLEQVDFLEADSLERGSFDAIVMGEVLEHVERPDRFLRSLSDLARPSAHIFISTCINAPAIDHIYNWESVGALETMIRDNGLEIGKSLVLPYEGRSLEQTEAEKLALNVAYVLEKADA